mgnify:CR=1 FL=1
MISACCTNVYLVIIIKGITVTIGELKELIKDYPNDLNIGAHWDGCTNEITNVDISSDGTFAYLGCEN